MVVTSGRSNRQVGAIADRVMEDLRKAGLKSVRVEGMPHCDWVLIDAGDVIVHVFRPEVRDFYQLEKMWARGRRRRRATARSSAVSTQRRPTSYAVSEWPGSASGDGGMLCGHAHLIAAVGRMKAGPERELADRYLKRAVQTGRSVGLTGFEVIEIRESRADNAARRMLEESIAIANVIPDRAPSRCCWTSAAKACRARPLPAACRRGATEDKPAVVFVIGGADGLAPGLKDKPACRSASARRPGRISWCG